MKKVFTIITALMIVFGSTAVTFAGEKGNARKGKFTYRKIYKTCFQKGLVNAKKPPISPDAKTQAQWKRIFDKKKFKQFGCEEEWAKLDEKQLLNIYTYLHDHAADSPSPAKCK